MVSRGPTSENSDMENANKPASSWPLKQGPKKWSKHGCDKRTLTVGSGAPCTEPGGGSLVAVVSSNQVGRADLTPVSLPESVFLILSRRRLWY